MVDKFEGKTVGNDAPIARYAVIVPNDTVDLPNPVRAIYVGSTGDLTVTGFDGEIATFRNLPVGLWGIMAKRVHSTGTTAGDLVGGR